MKQTIYYLIGIPAIMITTWIVCLHAKKHRKIRAAENQLLLISEAQSAIYKSFGTHRLSDDQKSATEILQEMSTRMNPSAPIFLKLWQSDEEEPRDPWGRKYCIKEKGENEAPIFYSAGPNGIDEGGAPNSDDILIPKHP